MQVAFCGPLEGGVEAGHLDEEGIVWYIRERAESNVGLLLALASGYVAECVAELATEDSLAGQLAELAEAVLVPVMQAMSKVGFLMAAIVIPPPDPKEDGGDDSKAMAALIALAKDMAFDIAEGSFTMSMFTSIESVGMPSSFDIAGGASMLSAVMQGTALNATYEEIRSYRDELDETARLLTMQATMMTSFASTTLVNKTSRGLNVTALKTMTEHLST
jgi:hypothetical protein